VCSVNPIKIETEPVDGQTSGIFQPSEESFSFASSTAGLRVFQIRRLVQRGCSHVVAMDALVVWTAPEHDDLYLNETRLLIDFALK
jgi:hypothetical protein